MIPNTEWRKAGACVVAAGVFSALCISSLLFLDGMGGGYAVALVSFFLAISSCAVTLLFINRARVMDAILADPSPLARWTYSEEQARTSVEREFEEYRARNRMLFILIGGMLAAVALFFLIAVEDGGVETALVLLGIAGLLFVVSRITPWLERRRASRAPHETVITRDGVVYSGTVYPFRSFLVLHDGTVLRKATTKRPAAIVFSFVQVTGRVTIQPFDVAVPVPPGDEEAAVRVVKEFGGTLP